MLYDVDSKKECCDTKYISLKTRPDEVCCGGRFHSFRDNYECCTDRYIKVMDVCYTVREVITASLHTNTY